MSKVKPERVSNLVKMAKVGWKQRLMMFRVFSRARVKYAGGKIAEGDQILVITISPPNPPFARDYNVVAIEANIDAPLEDHKHHVIGDYETKSEARRAADSFAKMWQKRAKVAQARDCACEEIESSMVTDN
jgi:hypothetical protein